MRLKGVEKKGANYIYSTKWHLTYEQNQVLTGFSKLWNKILENYVANLNDNKKNKKRKKSSVFIF